MVAPSLQSHRHGLLCEKLGLPSPDAGLTDEELAKKMQADEQRIAEEDAEEAARGEDELAKTFAQMRP